GGRRRTDTGVAGCALDVGRRGRLAAGRPDGGLRGTGPPPLGAVTATAQAGTEDLRDAGHAVRPTGCPGTGARRHPVRRPGRGPPRPPRPPRPPPSGRCRPNTAPASRTPP